MAVSSKVLLSEMKVRVLSSKQGCSLQGWVQVGWGGLYLVWHHQEFSKIPEGNYCIFYELLAPHAKYPGYGPEKSHLNDTLVSL